MLDEKRVEEYFTTLDRIKELEQKKLDIEAEFALAGTGVEVHGDYEIKWTTGKRFNADVALGLLTKKELTIASKTVVDGPKMKVMFPGKYAKAQIESAKPTIKVNLLSN